MSEVTLYHNPRCSKSRQALALLRDRGIEPEIIEYLKAPPDAATISDFLDKLGIKNGDIVHGVNGAGLTSTSGAMGAFQALQSESNFSFDLTRRRQKVSMDYEIR